jgi:hypothetical protein
MQLSSILLLHVNAQTLHKVKITKQKPRVGLCNWCLPCLDGEELVSGKLGECCAPNAPCSRVALEPIHHGMQEY